MDILPILWIETLGCMSLSEEKQKAEMTTHCQEASLWILKKQVCFQSHFQQFPLSEAPLVSDIAWEEQEDDENIEHVIFRSMPPQLRQKACSDTVDKQLPCRCGSESESKSGKR